MRAIPHITAPILVGALALGGCGSGTGASASHSAAGGTAGPSAAAPSHGPTAVSVANYAYAPAAVTVRAGTKITFTNRDATAHTATATGALSFDTGTLKTGASGTVTLTKPGTYSYMCQFHPFMKGTITVIR